MHKVNGAVMIVDCLIIEKFQIITAQFVSMTCVSNAMSIRRIIRYLIKLILELFLNSFRFV